MRAKRKDKSPLKSAADDLPPVGRADIDDWPGKCLLVDLPNDKVKGRFIGREGCNLRAFEKVTGVDVIIDETPALVIIMSGDPVKASLAHVVLARLVAGGRIYPARIESVFSEVRSQMQSPEGHVVGGGQIRLAVKTLNEELLKYVKRNPRHLHAIPPRVFEEIIAEILSSFGYSVELTSRTRDGGYDILALSTNAVSGLTESYIVECKRYREDRPVGVGVARSLYAVKQLKGVSNAVIATTSRFTRDVFAEFGDRWDFHLKDYEAIVEWLGNYEISSGGLYLRQLGLVSAKPANRDP